MYHAHRLAAVFVVLVLGTWAHAELPPEAQAALKKGVIAGQQQDFPLALRYFEEAHRLAPDATEIYYNLGLAESKTPGREFRAIAWFGAYLAANPTAPSATAIREQIEVLQVKQAGSTAKLLKLAEETAGKLPNDESYTGRWQKLEYVAQLYVTSGDLSAGRRIAALLKGHEDHEQSILGDILEAQANQGDVQGARQTLATIRLEDPGSFWIPIQAARALTKMGDAVGTKKALAIASKKVDRMSNADEGAGLQAPWGVRNEAHERVVEAQVEAGDPAGAEKTLKQLESNPRSDGQRTYCSAQVALGYAKVGDKTKALKYIAATRNLVSTTFKKEIVESNRYWCVNHLAMILPALAKAEAAVGQKEPAIATLTEALRFIELIPEPSEKYALLLSVAQAQFDVGELDAGTETMRAVRKLADDANDAKLGREIKAALAHSLEDSKQAPPRAITPADWLEMLNDSDLNNYSNSSPLASAPFLDLGTYLQSVPTETSERAYESIYKAAEKFVQANMAVGKLLKRQFEVGAK